jgi:hypothetical protein
MVTVTYTKRKISCNTKLLIAEIKFDFSTSDFNMKLKFLIFVSFRFWFEPKVSFLKQEKHTFFNFYTVKISNQKTFNLITDFLSDSNFEKKNGPKQTRSPKVFHCFKMLII